MFEVVTMSNAATERKVLAAIEELKPLTGDELLMQLCAAFAAPVPDEVRRAALWLETSRRLRLAETADRAIELAREGAALAERAIKR
jgi:hypothetical protein